MPLKQRANGPVGIANNLRGPFLVSPSSASQLLYRLERVAERSVAQVMQESGYGCHVSPLFIKFEDGGSTSNLALNNSDQLPRGMKNSNGMGEARMDRTREHELRDPKLLDPPKPLELRRID